MAKFNCLTYALKIEGILPPHTIVEDLEWYRTPLQALQIFGQKYLLDFREISPNDPMSDNEWLIAFFGFVPCEWDYERRVTRRDYHLVLYENGIWTHRMTWGADSTEANFDELVTAYSSAGYPPHYFAVKRNAEK